MLRLTIEMGERADGTGRGYWVVRLSTRTDTHHDQVPPRVFADSALFRQWLLDVCGLPR